MKNKTCGKIIIPPDIFPEKHELETAGFFAKIGKDIEFLKPAYTKGVRTPDIQMDGVLWEIKSPMGNGKRTLERAFRKSLKQSQNIIFDLRRTSIPDNKCISYLTQHFRNIKGIKRLLLVTKSNSLLLDIKK